MPRLLIVDDEEDVRNFATNFFRKRKIEVMSVPNGEEAAAVVGKFNPALVLLDIKMTGIDGVETLRRIKEINKDIKVIMVTGRKPEEDNTFDKCKQLGALDYIHKPLDLIELEKIVMSVLQANNSPHGPLNDRQKV